MLYTTIRVVKRRLLIISWYDMNKVQLMPQKVMHG